MQNTAAYFHTFVRQDYVTTEVLHVQTNYQIP